MERYAKLGLVSSGTLRVEDLLSAFADALEDLAGDVDLVREARNVDPSSEEATVVLDELYDALQEFAPPYCYFGTHHGDGAEFGFWLDYRALEDAEHDGELVRSEDPPSDSVPDAITAWLHVNDHGNATLYVRSSDNGWHEAWSVVVAEV